MVGGRVHVSDGGGVGDKSFRKVLVWIGDDSNRFRRNRVASGGGRGSVEINGVGEAV